MTKSERSQQSSVDSEESTGTSSSSKKLTAVATSVTEM